MREAEPGHAGWREAPAIVSHGRAWPVRPGVHGNAAAGRAGVPPVSGEGGPAVAQACAPSTSRHRGSAIIASGKRHLHY
jgi:hypothetical protein